MKNIHAITDFMEATTDSALNVKRWKGYAQTRYIGTRHSRHRREGHDPLEMLSAGRAAKPFKYVAGIGATRVKGNSKN